MLSLEEVIKNKNAIETIEEYIDNIKKVYEGIVIFGCSTTGKFTADALENLGITPICFCDEFEYENVKEYKGIPVYNIQQLDNYNKNIAIIITVNTIDLYYVAEKHLIKAGFKNFLDKDIILFYNKKKQYSLDCNNLVRNVDKKVVSFDKINFNITSNCTLNCRDCGELIPITRHLGHSDLSMLKKMIWNMMAITDYVTLMEVLGGEPMLHPDLDKILIYLSEFDNIFGIVIDTNGTIVPNDIVLSIIKDKNIAIRVTDYGILSNKKYELKRKCDELGIKCTVREVLLWDDFGPITYHDDSDDMKFSTCLAQNKCSSLFHGRWHICPRDSKLVELGIVSDVDEEYVDLLDDKISISDKRNKIYFLRNRKTAIRSCSFCAGTGTADGFIKKVKGGIQVKG